MVQVLANATLPTGDQVDLVVDEDGTVLAHAPVGSRPAGLDLGGRLVVGAFCEPHAHLDKALTADRVPNPTGDLMGAIDAWSARYHERTVEEVYERARRAAAMSLGFGTTLIRTHVDVGGGIELRALMALTQLREELAGIVDIEIVALVACPLTGPDGSENRAALESAIAHGADLLGGCPHLDPDPQGLIDVVLDASRDAGLPVDLHVDETLDPTMVSLELLANSVEARGHDQAVTASHCVSLSMQAPARQVEIADRVAAASIGIVALPQTNLFLQARGVTTAPPRGITPIDVLRDRGVVIAAGGDNVQDPFNPMGRGDPLETAALAVVAAHQQPGAALDLVARDARRLLGRPGVGYEIGDTADLVAVEASGVRDLIARAREDRLVLRGGRPVPNL